MPFMPRRRKNKTNNKKKIGKFGEYIIPKFGNAIEALRHRYKADFPDMTLYLHFNALGKNFVFQKIHSFPLKAITYVSEGHSIMFNAQWESDGAYDYILPKKAFEIDSNEGGASVGWGDVSDFKPKFYEEGEVMRGGQLISLDDADEIDANVDIRLDDVKSINMYDWGFELIGGIISILAVSDNVESPLPQKISMNVPNLSFDFGKAIGDDNLVVRWSQNGYEPVKEKSSDFNNLLFDEKKIEEQEPKMQIRKLGQRSMDNLIFDYED